MVIFSWGFTGFLPSQVPRAILTNLLQAFEKLDQKVIMKFDEEYLPFIPDNVMVAKWIPQQDLLGNADFIELD